MTAALPLIFMMSSPSRSGSIETCPCGDGPEKKIAESRGLVRTILGAAGFNRHDQWQFACDRSPAGRGPGDGTGCCSRCESSALLSPFVGDNPGTGDDQIRGNPADAPKEPATKPS